MLSHTAVECRFPRQARLRCTIVAQRTCRGEVLTSFMCPVYKCLGLLSHLLPELDMPCASTAGTPALPSGCCSSTNMVTWAPCTCRKVPERFIPARSWSPTQSSGFCICPLDAASQSSSRCDSCRASKCPQPPHMGHPHIQHSGVGHCHVPLLALCRGHR